MEIKESFIQNRFILLLLKPSGLMAKNADAYTQLVCKKSNPRHGAVTDRNIRLMAAREGIWQ